MKKRSLVPVVCFCVCCCQQLLSQQVTEQTIYFKVNRHELSSENRQLLVKKIDSLKNALKDYSIKISGNTDNTGSADFNYNLSQKRAMTVQQVFIETGIAAENISTAFNGAGSPIASNETEEGRSLNRRVDIRIEITSAPEKPVAGEAPAVPEGDISGLYSLLNTEAEKFCVDVTRDTFLVAKKGTIIHYKANTIKKQDLSCRCFTLSIYEYFDNTSLLFNNLTTTSDGQLLESGGMIKLDGYCDNKKYELKSGEFFTVMVPTDTVLPGMKLLSANRNNDSEYLNWQLDKYDPTIDDFDWYRMQLACGFVDGTIGKCPFFFCQIGNFFDGLFSSSRKYRNKDVKHNTEIEKEKDLIKKYQLKGEDLEEALDKSKDNSGKDALKYYVYKNYNWDYRNIDRYKPGIKFVNYIVDNKPSKEMDVKIVFKTSKTIVPSLEKTSSYIFKDINDDTDVWVVGLKYSVNKEIFLALKEVNTSRKRTTVEFKLVTLDELKRILEQINKRS